MMVYQLQVYKAQRGPCLNYTRSCLDGHQVEVLAAKSEYLHGPLATHDRRRITIPVLIL